MEVKKPVQVPANYGAAQNMEEKVIFAISEACRGNASEIVKLMEWHEPGADNKQLIADTHDILTELYKNGLINGTESDGTLLYSIKK
jgi:hydroxyethylthiazole kinase-like sugar kinase family protein